MSLTLNQATTEVRYRLNETTAAFWTDAQIEAWIKEGTRVVSSKGLLYETEVALTLVADQLSYASTDVVEIVHAYYTNAAGGAGNYKGLIKISPMKIGNLATSAAGIPKYYALWNRKTYIWPLPTAAVVAATGTVNLMCCKETDDITAINDEYQHLPIVYAAACAKQKDEKFNREEDAFGDFQIRGSSAPSGGQRA
jgi:hypothetical protein